MKATLETFASRIPVLRRAIVKYAPDREARPFVARAQTQSKDGIEASVAVLDAGESRRFFGVPIARCGVQPVWIRIANRSDSPCRLSLIGIDPNYYSSFEAAQRSHFGTGRRLLGFGLMALLFLPLLILVPIGLFTARLANRRIDAFFHEHAFRMRPIAAGTTVEGFVFTPLDEGNKIVHVQLVGPAEMRELTFSIPVAGLDTDYLRRQFLEPYRADEIVECDAEALRQYLIDAPATTMNRIGTRRGDPVNLVVIGDFATLLTAFCSRWDETETIKLSTCWKTVKSFLTGSEYRYSPVSPLYLFGRSQDFALQRIRESLNERLHLRLWVTPKRFRGQPVWIGQVSRDIGVRITWRTWSLTTHRIDPDVDEAREYVVEDLFHSKHVEAIGHVDGVGADAAGAVRRNLTGDPYFTDGQRAVLVATKSKVTPRLLAYS